MNKSFLPLGLDISFSRQTGDFHNSEFHQFLAFGMHNELET